MRLRGLCGVGEIKKKIKRLKKLCGKKTLTPPLPLPYRGGESTANGIVFQKKSYATFLRPKVPPSPIGEGIGVRLLGIDIL